MKFRLPKSVLEFLDGAEVVRDTVGESPARVYRVRKKNTLFFLKISRKTLADTTYSVGREARVLVWLQGRINVPEVILHDENAGWECMVTPAVPGKPLSKFIGDENRCVEAFTEAIRQLQAISVEECPFDSRVAERLTELDELMRIGTIDRDADLSVYPGIQSPKDLIARLKCRTVAEDPVFSHGDLGDSNLFLDERENLHFIDFGRGGVADRWMDIAFAYRNLAEEVSEEAARRLLETLNLRDKPMKRKYFEMLDELF